MQLLRDILEHAQKNRVAIGHFNVADLVLLEAVFSSAQELNVPVLVGASAGERAFMGIEQIAALVRKKEEKPDGLQRRDSCFGQASIKIINQNSESHAHCVQCRFKALPQRVDHDVELIPELFEC